jgi:hypothetical protein
VLALLAEADATTRPHTGAILRAAAPAFSVRDASTADAARGVSGTLSGGANHRWAGVPAALSRRAFLDPDLD